MRPRTILLLSVFMTAFSFFSCVDDLRLEDSVKSKVTDFKVLQSYHKPQGFFNEGRSYDYKFECATTVSLEEESESMTDWGYVYEDPDGKKAYISLKDGPATYTDTRYAYFRNQQESTVRLYGYTRYGESDYFYDKANDYKVAFLGGCPDNNHPHAIDLGLPSGTKWCCCNVGASAPEEYGGYYAWGETSEKSVYNHVTYKYFNGQDTDGDGWFEENFSVVDIGSDIAGTSYDVAHVKMGSPWRMPNIQMIEELIISDNTSWQWTSMNGVKGMLVRGKNGGQVFLPAAGDRWSDALRYVGSFGLCWSSSLSPGNDGYAAYLYFYSSGWGLNGYERNYGQPVRAVCP